MKLSTQVDISSGYGAFNSMKPFRFEVLGLPMGQTAFLTEGSENRWTISRSRIPSVEVKITVQCTNVEQALYHLEHLIESERN